MLDVVPTLILCTLVGFIAGLCGAWCHAHDARNRARKVRCAARVYKFASDRGLDWALGTIDESDRQARYSSWNRATDDVLELAKAAGVSFSELYQAKEKL